MIEYLNGKVLRTTGAGAIIVTGGVGYAVQLPEDQRSQLREGDEAQVFVHTHVREDALRLFGFATWEQKELFALLQTLGGVGPSIAMPIVESLGADDLMVAAQTEAAEIFKPIKGVGPKKAKTILIELRTKLENRPDLIGNASTLKPAQTRPGAHAESPLVRDLGSALSHLGYREKEYAKVAAELIDKNPDAPLESLVRMALSALTISGSAQTNLFREGDL